MDPSAGEGSVRRRRKLAAIMMADVSGFSRMMGADEESTVDLIRDFHQRVKLLVERFEGRVVDTAGDSVFGEFDSVVNAMSCACRIQQDQAAANESRNPSQRVETRIGVHLGDVIVEDYRVYGDGVNIAARLEPLAAPGGICLSEAVYQQVRSKLDLRVEDLGLRDLKNIEHPLRLYRVAPPYERRAEAARGAEVVPAAAGAGPAPLSQSWLDELVRPAVLVPAVVALFLITSPIAMVPSAGVLPTAGTILLAVVLGRAWARRTGRWGSFLVLLGIGIGSGAAWTNWSRTTNVLFLLGGAIVAASGAGSRRKSGRSD